MAEIKHYESTEENRTVRITHTKAKQWYYHFQPLYSAEHVGFIFTNKTCEKIQLITQKYSSIIFKSSIVKPSFGCSAKYNFLCPGRNTIKYQSHKD